MGDDNGNGLCFAGGIMVGLLVGILIANWATNAVWDKACIERGVAAYDQQTGEWKWTVEKKPSEVQ